MLKGYVLEDSTNEHVHETSRVKQGQEGNDMWTKLNSCVYTMFGILRIPPPAMPYIQKKYIPLVYVSTLIDDEK